MRKTRGAGQQAIGVYTRHKPPCLRVSVCRWRLVKVLTGLLSPTKHARSPWATSLFSDLDFDISAKPSFGVHRDCDSLLHYRTLEAVCQRGATSHVAPVRYVLRSTLSEV